MARFGITGGRLLVAVLLLAPATAQVKVTPAAWQPTKPLVAETLVATTLTVKNGGQAPVKILAAAATRGINLALPKRSLAPGEAIKVKASVTPPQIDGDQGEYKAEIMFLLDSAQDRVQVPVKFNLVRKTAKNVTVNKPQRPAYEPRPDDHPITVTFFFSGGCGKCRDFLEQVLEPLKAHYHDAPITWDLHDTVVGDEAAKLLQMKRQYGLSETSENTYLFLNSRAYAGNDEIQAHFAEAIEAELASPTQPPPVPAPDPAGPAGPALSPQQTAAREAASYTVPLLLGAGLADGINPCAIATAVFLIVMLTRLGHDRRSLLLAGGAYALAVFLTYYLLGLGLLKAFAWFEGKLAVARGINIVVGLAALVFAFLQVRDVMWYRATGSTRDLTMQMPLRAKQLAHAWLRENLSRPLIGLGCFIAGTLVTLLEAICTGQVYVPVLASLAKTPELRARALSLLAVYDLGFVLPLLVVLGLTYAGITSDALAAAAKRHLVPAKMALATLLVVLGAYLLVAGP